MINLYLGDCMEAMKGMKDNQYDLAIVDPPYGIGADKKNSELKKQSNKSLAYSKDYGSQRWDSEIPDKFYFQELKRVTKNQIIWGGNYFGLIGGYIYWDKLVDMPTYSDGEIAFCSMIKSIRKFTFRWHGMLKQNNGDNDTRVHPTQKPVALYKWLLKNYAKEGDRILDTHGGSMSIAIACADMGFDLDIWEIDKDYFDAAVKRLKNHVNQLNAFQKVPEINIYE